MPNVFVATPTYQEHVHAAYAASLTRDILLATKTPWMVAPPAMLQGTLISFMRNDLFQAFVENPIWDAMLFIDSDLGWDPHGVQKILEAPGDIAGGCYRKKCDEVEYSFWPLDPAFGPCHPVETVPGGFMRITREAGQKIYTAHKKPFRHIIENDEEFGEDVSFCKRAAALGLSIYGRFDIHFSHHGVTSWDGNAMADLNIPVKEATHGG